MLYRACTDVAALFAAGHDIRVAVNVSPHQLSYAGFVNTVGRILDETGIEPHRLELEITEGVFLGHEEQTVSRLQELAACACPSMTSERATAVSPI